MDYEQLAREFMQSWGQLMKNPIHKESVVTSKGEFGVLGYLAYVQNGVSPGCLKDQFGVVSGRMADTLTSLSKKNLVERRSDETDGRKTLVYLTEDGRKAIMEKQNHIMKKHIELLKFLGEEDAKDLIRLVRRVSQYRDNVSNS